jgi:hypothetical protein
MMVKRTYKPPNQQHSIDHWLRHVCSIVKDTIPQM